MTKDAVRVFSSLEQEQRIHRQRGGHVSPKDPKPIPSQPMSNSGTKMKKSSEILEISIPQQKLQEEKIP